MGDAPAARALKVSLATIDKNYAVAVAVAMQDLDNDNAASHVDFADAPTTVENTWRVDVAQATGAYRLADAAAESTVIGTLATSSGTSWVQFLIDQAEAERDLGDAIAQAVQDRTGDESQAASDLALAGHYAGELPAAFEVNTTRLEVRDASSQHYQKWVDYFTSGPDAVPSFSSTLPQSRLGGTQLEAPTLRQGLGVDGEMHGSCLTTTAAPSIRLTRTTS